MASNRVFRTFLLAAGAVLLTACATQTVAPNQTLDAKYFEREANNYLKFQDEKGQTVYCQNVSNTASLIPYKYCITESSLRALVEDSRRTRNAVQPGIPAGVGQGSIGGG